MYALEINFNELKSLKELLCASNIEQSNDITKQVDLKIHECYMCLNTGYLLPLEKINIFISKKDFDIVLEMEECIRNKIYTHPLAASLNEKFHKIRFPN